MLEHTGGAWHPVSPHLPAALNEQHIRVLRLTRASHGNVALLAAGTAPSVRLLAWQPTPSLPAGRTVTLALPSGGGTAALAADAGTLTVWRLAANPAAWVQAQTIKVPIQYGSSN